MKQSTPSHSDEPKGAEAKQASPEKKSPQDWAAHLGQVGRLRVPFGEPYFKDHRHPMARTIHGWAAHEYHEGGPFLLSLEDYQAALKTAESFPYVPHKPALTQYAPREYTQPAK